MLSNTIDYKIIDKMRTNSGLRPTTRSDMPNPGYKAAAQGVVPLTCGETTARREPLSAKYFEVPRYRLHTLLSHDVCATGITS